MRCVGLRLFQDALRNENKDAALQTAKDDFDAYVAGGGLPGYVVSFLQTLKEKRSSVS